MRNEDGTEFQSYRARKGEQKYSRSLLTSDCSNSKTNRRTAVRSTPILRFPSGISLSECMCHCVPAYSLCSPVCLIRAVHILSPPSNTIKRACRIRYPNILRPQQRVQAGTLCPLNDLKTQSVPRSKHSPSRL
jgi:hypothetical protein